MKCDIIFAGVGGQGIISAAAMVVAQATKLSFNCKQNEVHGMAQRGGAVVCHVRISNEEIFSDIIPKGAADIILGTEPMEALRYIEYLSPNGVVITSNRPIKNIEYPDVSNILKSIKGRCNATIVDVDALVNELKNERVVNVAMLGALSNSLNISGLKEGLIKEIEKRFSSGGEKTVETNLRAFEFGYNGARQA